MLTGANRILQYGGHTADGGKAARENVVATRRYYVVSRLHRQQRLRIDIEGYSYQHSHLGVQRPLAVEHFVQLAVGDTNLCRECPLRHTTIFYFVFDYLSRMGGFVWFYLVHRY